MKRSRFAVTLLAALSLIGMSACDSGPSGPAIVSGTVIGPADLAAVVLDVVWAGVQGFEGMGSTQAYSAPVEDDADRYRVILVGPTGGALTFGIAVDDVYLEAPVVTLVEAAGSDDLPRPLGNIRVLLER